VKRAILGLVLLGAAVLGLMSLRHRADRIRAENMSVVADVVGTKGSRAFESLRVEYTFGGQPYRSILLDLGWADSWEPGDRIVLAIDPDRPTDAAGPGLVSGSQWRYWYQPVGVAGLVLLLVAAWQVIRRPKPDDDIPVARILIHPEPAWADRSDGTVNTLIPGTAQPPWEEELPVRRIDADTIEICCVPLLQTRLALGDVVRVNARGFAGEVVRPSGRVTFALRSDHPADIRGLADEFPGTVVEQVGADLFAIAADGNADEIQGRLRSWNQVALSAEEFG
jgi:hypothetical protein